MKTKKLQLTLDLMEIRLAQLKDKKDCHSVMERKTLERRIPYVKLALTILR